MLRAVPGSHSVASISIWFILFSRTGHDGHHCLSLRAKESTGRDENKRGERWPWS